MTSTFITHCNPKNHTETWTGKGRRPGWLNEMDWKDQTDSMHLAKVLYGNKWLTPDELAKIKARLTVTENQEELPGLPGVPKKRGRPATGKALTAAERKAESRRRALKRVYENIETASITALLENYAGYYVQDARAMCTKIAQELMKRAEKLETPIKAE